MVAMDSIDAVDTMGSIDTVDAVDTMGSIDTVDAVDTIVYSFFSTLFSLLFFRISYFVLRTSSY